MPDFSVTEKKRKDLELRMAEVGLKEDDIEERFTRSGGPGGQHANKNSTCVVLRHRPSGLETRCLKERSQSMNRFLARRQLADKLENMIKGEKSRLEQEREKIRRQKRRRSRRAKAKMMDDKHHQSVKKQQRTFRPGQE